MFAKVISTRQSLRKQRKRLYEIGQHIRKRFLTHISSAHTCRVLLDRRQYISTNVDKKSLETVFFISICRPTGDKWQSKTLFLAIFDQCSSIVKSVSDCHLSGVRVFCTSIQWARNLVLSLSLYLLYFVNASS